MNLQMEQTLSFLAVPWTKNLVKTAQVSHCLIFPLLIKCKIALNRALPSLNATLSLHNSKNVSLFNYQKKTKVIRNTVPLRSRVLT